MELNSFFTKIPRMPMTPGYDPILLDLELWVGRSGLVEIVENPQKKLQKNYKTNNKKTTKHTKL